MRLLSLSGLCSTSKHRKKPRGTHMFIQLWQLSRSVRLAPPRRPLTHIFPCSSFIPPFSPTLALIVLKVQSRTYSARSILSSSTMRLLECSALLSERYAIGEFFFLIFVCTCSCVHGFAQGINCYRPSQMIEHLASRSDPFYLQVQLGLKLGNCCPCALYFGLELLNQMLKYIAL